MIVKFALAPVVVVELGSFRRTKQLEHGLELSVLELYKVENRKEAFPLMLGLYLANGAYIVVNFGQFRHRGILSRKLEPPRLIYSFARRTLSVRGTFRSREWPAHRILSR